MSEDLFHLGIKALIRNGHGEILLLKLDPAVMGGGEYWDMPGGRVQYGHSVEETLRREIEEETGLHDVSIGRHVGMAVSPVRIKQGESDFGLILTVYECKISEDEPIVPADGHIAYEWVAPNVAKRRLVNKYPLEFRNLIVGTAT